MTIHDSALSACARHCGGARVVIDLWVEILVTCDIHGGSALVLELELELDGHADHCCLLTLDRAAVTLVFDALPEWL